MTIKKIAELAGVSAGTVDRVVNNRGKVKKEVSERIQKIIKEVEYVPNFSAKSLALKKRAIKIGFIFHSKNSYFDSEVMNGIEQAKEELKDFGVEVIIRSSRNFDEADQLNIIDELVSLNVNALAITPINTLAIAKKIDFLISINFPIFCFINDIKCAREHPFIGPDAEETGRIAAGLFSLFANGQKNKIGIITPSIKILGHKQKVEGLTNVVSRSYKNLSVAGVCELNGTSDISVYKDVVKYLDDNPEINMLWYASSVSDGGITALKERELLGKCRIVTLDLQRFIINGLEEGYIAATIGQNPYLQGYKTMKIMFNSIVSEYYAPDLSFGVPCEIFIKENYPYKK